MITYERRFKVLGQADAARLRSAIAMVGGRISVEEIYDEYDKRQGEPSRVRVHLPIDGTHYGDASDRIEREMLEIVRKLNLPDWEDCFCDPYFVTDGGQPVGHLVINSPQGGRDQLGGRDIHCGEGLDMLVPRKSLTDFGHAVRPWLCDWLRVRYELAWPAETKIVVTRVDQAGAGEPTAPGGNQPVRPRPVLYITTWCGSVQCGVPEGGVFRWPDHDRA